MRLQSSDTREPLAGRVEELAGFEEVAEHLLDEEGVAFGFGEDEGDQLRRRLAAGAALEELRDALFVHPGKDDLVGQALAQQLGEDRGQRAARPELGVSVGPDRKQWDFGHALRQVLHQQQRRLVGPVEVLEYEQDGVAPRVPADEFGDAVQQVAALLLGGERYGLGDVGVARTQLGHQLGDLRRVLTERLAQRLGREVARRLLEVLDGREVGRRTLLVDAVAGEHVHAEAPRLVGRLLHQARLPDAGLSADQDQRAGTVARSLRGLEQPCALPGAADVGSPLAPRKHAAVGGIDPRHLVDLPGRVDALERELAAILELAAGRAEHAVHGVRRKDRAGGRNLFDALGEDQGLSVEAAVVAEDFARMEPDAKLYSRVGLAPIAALDRPLDLLGAGHGAARRLERHHQPVAGVLHQDSALLLHLGLRQGGQLSLDGGGGLVPQALVERGGADQVS
jgi:hypothetical protein